MENPHYDKVDKVLKPFTVIKLTIDGNQTISGEIVKNWLSNNLEVYCQVLTAEKFGNTNDIEYKRAILTTSDNIERSCIISDYTEDIPVNSIELRSIDLNK